MLAVTPRSPITERPEHLWSQQSLSLRTHEHGTPLDAPRPRLGSSLVGSLRPALVATVSTATAVCWLLLCRSRARLALVTATTTQAAVRGWLARRALHDVLTIGRTLDRLPGEHLCMDGFTDMFRLGVVGPPCRMDAYFAADQEYIDLRTHLAETVEELTASVCKLQASVRRWFVRRCLLPSQCLWGEIAENPEAAALARHILGPTGSCEP